MLLSCSLFVAQIKITAAAAFNFCLSGHLSEVTPSLKPRPYGTIEICLMLPLLKEAGYISRLLVCLSASLLEKL